MLSRSTTASGEYANCSALHNPNPKERSEAQWVERLADRLENMCGVYSRSAFKRDTIHVRKSSKDS